MYSGSHHKDEGYRRNSWPSTSIIKFVEHDDLKHHRGSNTYHHPIIEKIYHENFFRSTLDYQTKTWKMKQQEQTMAMGPLAAPHHPLLPNNSRRIIYEKSLQKPNCLDYYICEDAFLYDPEVTTAPSTSSNSNHTLDSSSINSHNSDDKIPPSRCNIEYFDSNQYHRKLPALPPLSRHHQPVLRSLFHSAYSSSSHHRHPSLSTEELLPSRLAYLNRSTSSSSFVEDANNLSDTIRKVRDDQSRILESIQKIQEDETSLPPSQQSPSASGPTLCTRERIRIIKDEQCKIMEQMQQRQQSHEVLQHLHQQLQEHSLSLSSLSSSCHSIHDNGNKIVVTDSIIEEQRQIMRQIEARKNVSHRNEQTRFFSNYRTNDDNVNHVYHDNITQESLRNYQKELKLPRNIIEEQEEIWNSIKERMH